MFYFIMHPGGDRKKIQVFDLQESFYYERNEWRLVTQDHFISKEKAIKEALRIARLEHLEYVPFESRYD